MHRKVSLNSAVFVALCSIVTTRPYSY